MLNVQINFKDTAALEREATEGAAMGFSGKFNCGLAGIEQAACALH